MAEELKQVENAPATPPAGTTPPPAGDPATPKPNEAPAPADYSVVRVPEGSKMDPAKLEAVVSWAKEKQLAPEVAQEILNREHEALASFEAGQAASYEKEKEAWLESLKSDKELGGDNMNKKVELAQRVVKKFASEEFLNILNSTGYGNHPELVRVFARVAEAIGEDHLVLPGSAAGVQKDPRELFYGKQP